MRIFEGNYAVLCNQLGAKTIQYFKEKTAELNKREYGDHACFHIEHA